MSKVQLYLWEGIRNKKISEIELYENTFIKKICCIFDNLEKEAEQISNDYYEKAMNGFSPEDSNFDPTSIAEDSLGLGIDYYQNYSLMKYNTLAMWTTMLYQMWEQQVRLFLYEEERHYFDIEFKKFCSSGINEIKTEFKKFNTDIERLESWHKIDELRLLANVFKHGDGQSAKILKEIRPDIFKDYEISNHDLLSLYNTTLLEKVVNVNESDFCDYCHALISFWRDLPEYMY